MKSETRSALVSFLIELGVYAVLVVLYYFLVLHFLGDWLLHTFQHSRKSYAVLALVLIVGQGFLLEMLTTTLLRFIQREREQ